MARKLHRIATVRKKLGISLQSVASKMGADATSVEKQENELTDLHVSELLAWQQALDVSVEELLVDPLMPVSRPTLDRANVLRMLKTAKEIHELATRPRVKRQAAYLISQLNEFLV